MKFSTLLVINAILAFVYAIILLLLPATFLTIYGITAGQGEQLMSRLFGVALVSVGIITWFARGISDVRTHRAIIIAQLTASVLGAIVTIVATLSGVMNLVGWSGVLVYLLLALAYGYFLFNQSKAS